MPVISFDIFDYEATWSYIFRNRIILEYPPEWQNARVARNASDKGVKTKRVGEQSYLQLQSIVNPP